MHQTHDLSFNLVSCDKISGLDFDCAYLKTSPNYLPLRTSLCMATGTGKGLYSALQRSSLQKLLVVQA
jgi:hypothetical protein